MAKRSGGDAAYGRSGDTPVVLAASVARRHYLGGQSKVEIADALGISRFKVARLLDLALEKGIVRIEIVDPVGVHAELSDALQTRLGLTHCVVVPVVHDDPDVRRQVGAAAAAFLSSVLTDDDVLGLPWSRSVLDMVAALDRLPRVPVVQLSGSLTLADEDSSSVDVVRRAARIAGGGRHVFYAPMVLDDASAAATLLRQPAVKDALEHARSVTVAVIGIGAWQSGETVYEAVRESTRQVLERAGAVGEAVGVVFDAEGTVLQTTLTQRMIAVPAEDLLAIPHFIAVAHGAGKVTAIRAAVRGGIATSLVTTQDTAELLLA